MKSVKGDVCYFESEVKLYLLTHLQSTLYEVGISISISIYTSQYMMRA